MRILRILIFLAIIPVAYGADTWTIIDPVDFSLSNGANITVLPNQSGELIQIDQNLTFTLTGSNITFWAQENLTLWNISYILSLDKLSYNMIGSAGSNLSTNATMGAATTEYQIRVNGSNESTTFSDSVKVVRVSRIIVEAFIEIFRIGEIPKGMPQEQTITFFDTSCLKLCPESSKIHIYNQNGEIIGELSEKNDYTIINSTQITLSIDHNIASRMNNDKFMMDFIESNKFYIIAVLLILGTILSIFYLIRKITKP